MATNETSLLLLEIKPEDGEMDLDQGEETAKEVELEDIQEELAKVEGLEDLENVDEDVEFELAYDSDNTWVKFNVEENKEGIDVGDLRFRSDDTDVFDVSWDDVSDVLEFATNVGGEVDDTANLLVQLRDEDGSIVVTESIEITLVDTD